ncbi:MAG: disulfide bond formation protein B [Neisseria sp.]|nr:disulfide bond formation protein B [Neisseria sp.]
MTYRTVNLLLLAVGIVCSAASFFAQYVLLLNPCPLCIVQRLSVLSFTLAAALSLLLPTRKTAARRTATLLMSLPALWCGTVAAYQLWLQSLPSDLRPSCGAPWTFRLREWPLFDYWEFAVRGLGDCGTREWLFGLPLPVWSLLFSAVVLAGTWTALFKCRP